MSNEILNLYQSLLRQNREADREEDIKFTRKSYDEISTLSAAYQKNAMINGKHQPIMASRTQTRKCKISVDQNFNMKIGDLVYVFGEYWLCVELYTDEYGLTYGEIWLCNHKLRYQCKDGSTIEKYAIIDNGSYSKGADKAIPTTDNSFICYVSLDEESSTLYVDKRLAIGVVQDSNGEEILEVGKIVWMDFESNNFGNGSHLLSFRLSNDVYNKERDNIDLMICDYIYDNNASEDETTDVTNNAEYLVSIKGKDTICIGTERTYKAFVTDVNRSDIDTTFDALWHIEDAPDGVTINAIGSECLLHIPLDDELIGETITIGCADSFGLCIPGTKKVTVISIG